MTLDRPLSEGPYRAAANSEANHASSEAEQESARYSDASARRRNGQTGRKVRILR